MLKIPYGFYNSWAWFSADFPGYAHNYIHQPISGNEIGSNIKERILYWIWKTSACCFPSPARSHRDPMATRQFKINRGCDGNERRISTDIQCGGQILLSPRNTPGRPLLPGWGRFQAPEDRRTGIIGHTAAGFRNGPSSPALK
jgi:hypothetical protein